MSLIADVQASRSAKALEPEKLAKLVDRADYPILITGGKLLEDERLVDFAVKVAEKGIDVIACSASSKPLIVRGVKPKFTTFSLHYIAQFILDEDFRVNGNRIDTAIFIGFMPYYLSRVLSGLKHFSKIVTIALEPYYHPHASYSLPKVRDADYYDMLNRFVEALEVRV